MPPKKKSKGKSKKAPDTPSDTGSEVTVSEAASSVAEPDNSGNANSRRHSKSKSSKPPKPQKAKKEKKESGGKKRRGSKSSSVSKSSKASSGSEKASKKKGSKAPAKARKGSIAKPPEPVPTTSVHVSRQVVTPPESEPVPDPVPVPVTNKKSISKESSTHDTARKSLVEAPKIIHQSDESDHTAASTEEESGTTASESGPEAPEEIKSNASIPSEAVAPVDPTSMDSDPTPPPPVEVAPEPEPQESEHSLAKNSQASYASTNELRVTNLPYDTTMGDLHALFPQAIGMRLAVSSDKYDRGSKTARIEFDSKYLARKSYYKVRNAYVKGAKVEFYFKNYDPKKEKKLKEKILKEASQEEEKSRERPDPIPMEKVDKHDMIRKWIDIQKAVADEESKNAENQRKLVKELGRKKKKTK